MKRKKRLLLGGVSLSFLGLMSFAYINGTGGNGLLGSGNPATFEQNPPVPLEFRVQKLHAPLANGNNMILGMRCEDPGYILPSELNIYQSSGSMTAFHDDRIAPDVASGDRIYSAYIMENINAFLGRVNTRNQPLPAMGNTSSFTVTWQSGRAPYLFTDMAEKGTAASYQLNVLYRNEMSYTAAVRKSKSQNTGSLRVYPTTTRTDVSVDPARDDEPHFTVASSTQMGSC